MLIARVNILVLMLACVVRVNQALVFNVPATWVVTQHNLAEATRDNTQITRLYGQNTQEQRSNKILRSTFLCKGPFLNIQKVVLTI